MITSRSCIDRTDDEDSAVSVEDKAAMDIVECSAATFHIFIDG